jgi:hypothetical protein
MNNINKNKWSLEISNIGAACSKNPFESKNKIMLMCLCKCKQYKSIYKHVFYNECIIKDITTKTYDSELRKIYDLHKKHISSSYNTEIVKETVLKKLKQENTNMTESDISHAESFLDNSVKKDLGINNEPKVIKNKRYIPGNNSIYTYSENNWQIRGFHDAKDVDVIIEVKTRMSERNIRKNEYDLYQLFGYLLVMCKTKGKIVQYFDNKIYDSDIETNYEYGIIDINEEPNREKFKKFLKELRNFFDELNEYTNENLFDIWTVFNKTELPIAVYDINGIAHNINPKYEKIIKSLIN